MIATTLRRLGFVPALLVAGSAFAQDAPKAGLIVDLDAYVREICVAKDGREIDIANARFYRDSVISIGSGAGKRYFSVEGETLKISENKNFESFYFTEVENDISDGNGLDIELSFAEIDHVEYLYWKETFRHSRYRSGLFSLSSEGISSVCEGAGGTDSRT